MLALLSSIALLLAPSSSPVLRGPAVVVTLKDGCPCAQECHLALNALAHACRGKIRFVGVLDGDARKAVALAREADLRFPIVPDPRLILVRTLKAHEALDLRFVDGGDKILGSWNGLDRANVSALVDSVRTGTGVDVSLDLSSFTQLPKFGCVFPD